MKTLHATNLPIQASPLVGRRRELEELGPLLAGSRLVTLTGPGGSGKTRLALQLAADVLEEFPHGVFWVPLQSIRDPSLVVPTIAQTLGSKNGLAEHVGDKRLLLLLDNLEQVIESAPALSELLAQTQNIKLLITSREPLRVAGERRFPVEPLWEPDAVTLFLERARAVEPAFVPSGAVVEICRRLDGLPLALELAAACVGLFPADELLARLERALPLLTLGARDAPERQRTLRTAIAWSHDLLDEDGQRLFRRLAVFAASFELAAADDVCGASVERLQSLLDKSLVRRLGSGRLGMLETIHEYADERLAASGEGDAVARRHAEHYLAVAESANLGSEPDDALQDFDLVARELDNLRRAYAWAVSRDETETALRIALATHSFWAARDCFEGARWLETLLESSADVPVKLKLDSVRDYGTLVFLGGDFERGLELQRQALEEYRRFGDERGLAELLGRLSVESIMRDDPLETRLLAEEALAVNRRLGRRRGEVMALHALAEVEWGSGSRERAVELMERSGALARAIGFTWFEDSSLYVLAEWAIEQRDWRRAGELARESLALAHSIGERRDAVYLLALLARIGAEEGDERSAGLLWGAIEAEERRGFIGQWEAERDKYAAPVLTAAGEDFERGRGEGRLLTLEQAIERTLARD